MRCTPPSESAASNRPWRDCATGSPGRRTPSVVVERNVVASPGDVEGVLGGDVPFRRIGEEHQPAVVIDQQQRVGVGGTVDDVRPSTGAVESAPRADLLAVGDRRGQCGGLVVARRRQRSAGGGETGERGRVERCSEFDRHGGRRIDAESEPAMRLVHAQAGDSEVGECRPGRPPVRVDRAALRRRRRRRARRAAASRSCSSSVSTVVAITVIRSMVRSSVRSSVRASTCVQTFNVDIDVNILLA